MLVDTVDEELVRNRSLDVGRHSIDALLAPASERLCKLTFGLIIETDCDAWPAKKIKPLSHRVAKLHTECVGLIDTRLVRAAQVIPNHKLGAVGSPVATAAGAGSRDALTAEEFREAFEGLLLKVQLTGSDRGRRSSSRLV